MLSFRCLDSVMISTAMVSLWLIQDHLSVSGDRNVYSVLVSCLSGGLPRIIVVSIADSPDFRLAVDHDEGYIQQ